MVCGDVRTYVSIQLHVSTITYAPSLNERLEVNAIIRLAPLKAEALWNQLLFSLGATWEEARAATSMELWLECCCGQLSVPLMDDQMWADDTTLPLDRRQAVGG